MESSFTPTEELIKARVEQQKLQDKEIPDDEILLTRLCMHVHGKLLDSRNNMLRAQGINETLFMALMILDTKDSGSIQPSELSAALGSSRTNATRIADELEKNGWIERKESHNDRRCLHLHLTEKGSEFLNSLLPPQHAAIADIWSVLDKDEKEQLGKLMRKLLKKLDTVKN
ncbi:MULTISPECIES: transcriptional repressor MprA [Providencia]|uniref:Transcription repressor n=1 Tax=Providencia heimbachae ATCC 35613 TaxID=1354272 RepID=A0A1B7JZA5_9GAMM|nr:MULTISPECIES: transcriptional repressor MprA [Providencia]MBP6122892.1 transcriptional repressor MprA [Providencia sp.]MDD9341424.1 transcriptional repressor MprA [Providencia heimbachae]NIH23673.1 transcriptional repressor MprA [Providencia heimbachae]OAT53220.1 transcription repressor [Providencia heimbachae ATCC 35613]QCJ71126.1 transcriptional repressor MprA [Providencia heimbachae]